MTFGERIQDARKKKGLSQEQIAEVLQVSRQAVAKWEKDVSEPSVDMLIGLSKLLETDLNYLLKGENLQPDERVIYVERKCLDWEMILLTIFLSISFIGMVSMLIFSVMNPKGYPSAIQEWYGWFIPQDAGAVGFLLIFIFLLAAFIFLLVKLLNCLKKTKGDKND